MLHTSEEVHRIKRAAVLREATKIIVRRGYHRTSLDDVAEALGVSKGTLYNYIKDKQEILFECHRMSLDIGDQAFAFAEEHGKTGYARLRLMLRAYLTWLNGQIGGAGVTTDVTALRPADQRATLVRRDQVEARLARFIEEGIADGTLRPVDAKVAVYTLMGAVNTVQDWFSPDGRLTLEEVVRSVIDILMRGVDTAADARHVDLVIPPYESFERAAPVVRKRSSARRKAS